MCQFLLDKQCTWDRSSTYSAVCGGHIELLRWLVGSGCPWDGRDLCCAAAERGHIEVLSYLQQQGFQADADLLTRMLDKAACYDKLPAAKWLKDQGAAWPESLYRYW
jgi:hypothetical protein